MMAMNDDSRLDYSDAHPCDPDGMQMKIRELQAKNDLLKEALQSLYDVQNGPPLVSYEKEWNAAMKEAEKWLIGNGNTEQAMEIETLKEQMRDMLVFDEPPTHTEWKIMRLEMRRLIDGEKEIAE